MISTPVPTKPFELAGTTRRLTRLSSKPGRVGESADHIIVVIDGLVGRLCPGAGAARTLVDVAGPGTVLADGLVAPFTWRTDLMALHKATITAVPIGVARDIIAAQPRILVALLSDAYSTHQRLAEALAERTTMTAEARTFSQLLRIAERCRGSDQPGGAPITISITMDMLGSAAGTTRQTVSAALQGAAQAGMVQVGRAQITVLQPRALRDLVGRTRRVGSEAGPASPDRDTATPRLAGSENVGSYSETNCS